MKHVQHSVRLPLALDRALREAAQSRQVTAYALLQHCVRTGLASLAGDATAAETTAEMAREIGAISARLAHAEKLGERALFSICAASVFARAAAGPRDETKLTAEINAAFTRQLTLAGDL